jgi:hypothetical protein
VDARASIGLLACAAKVVHACVAERTIGSRTREPWLKVEVLAEGSLCGQEFELSARHGRSGSRKRLERVPWFPEPAKKELDSQIGAQAALHGN